MFAVLLRFKARQTHGGTQLKVLDAQQVDQMEIVVTNYA
jgi:hypothetical protein